MTPKDTKAHDEALEALIAASLRAPDKEQEITEEEIRRYVDQSVTLSAEDENALTKSESDLNREVARILRNKPLAPSVEKTHSTHTQGLFFRRAAFDAYVIHYLRDDPNLGRTKIEKITHLAEYHCGVDFEREPLRDAAGPVDYISRRKVESLAKKQGWYTVVEAKVRRGVKYLPGEKLEEALPIAVKTLGAQKIRVDAVIDIMRPLSTRACEIVATLFAAWNDLLLNGNHPTDPEIVADARGNWHPKKLTIPISEWLEGLTWLKRQEVIPKGTGRPVRFPRDN